MSEIDIVSAKSCHSKIIWEWRNDPITRKMSNNNEKISWEDHSCWYEKILLNKSRKLYLGEQRGIPIGVVRFDKCDEKEYFYEVNINISPASRGKGFGKRLINYGIKRFLKEVDNCKFIRAEVKKNNKSSNKLFKSCGFILFKNDSEINYYGLSFK